VILDPPRRGTSKGVIEAVAARTPSRVLHVFCNPDVLATELQRWFVCGYDILRVVPFDLFPGTDEIETMVLLGPRSQ
jgi:tRNA/tmRNA/rRNA uracil-C5-methylase (TrmA/RlmC/RlmD family)